MKTALLRCVALLPLALWGSGCGAEGPTVPLYPATGKVMFKGQPAAGAVVTLVPVSPAGADVPASRGVAGEDGTFRLTTFARDDGAPAGEYRVTVRWPSKAADPEAAPGPFGADRLNGRYADPNRSGLRAAVAPGATDLAPLELK
jgi:hypothetical protein